MNLFCRVFEFSEDRSAAYKVHEGITVSGPSLGEVLNSVGFKNDKVDEVTSFTSFLDQLLLERETGFQATLFLRSGKGTQSIATKYRRFKALVSLHNRMGLIKSSYKLYAPG